LTKKRLREGLLQALLKELNKRQVTAQNQEILVMEEGVIIAANQAEEEIRGDDRTQIVARVLETIDVMIRVEEKTVVLVETTIMGAKIIDIVEIIPGRDRSDYRRGESQGQENYRRRDESHSRERKSYSERRDRDDTKQGSSSSSKKRDT
jgi:hypothetical protein